MREEDRVSAAIDRLTRVAGMTLLTGTLACGRPPTSGTESGLSTSVKDSGAGILRLTGTVEAVQVRTVAVPRLLGPQTPLLIIGLVPAASRVTSGGVVVEFDPQQQERNFLDSRAQVVNLDGQIDKKRAAQAAVAAKDQTELTAAKNDVERARLEMRK